jgi:hypothetical protein
MEDTINLSNRPRRYVRKGRRGALQSVEITPEAKLSREEKMAVTLARPPRHKPENWYQERVNSQAVRLKKARGHILRVHEMTGENPNEIMARLGLTDEERALIHPFTSRLVWE